MNAIPSKLDAILARKRVEVAERRAQVPEAELLRRLTHAPPPRSLCAALSTHGGPLRVIAELKRASPSAGAISAISDPAALARAYEAGGAAAISVLTDGPGFGGTLADLTNVRSSVQVPVLRKDFIVDPYQLLEARVHGADAALLIVAALDDSTLRTLLRTAHELSLDALVEVHDAAELSVALEAGAALVGINNRNLRTFEVDLAVSEALLPRVPAPVRVVAESGVRTLADAQRLRAAGATNLLVGEALVRSAAPAELLRAIGASR